MKIITVQTLIERIKDDAQTNRGCGLVFLVLLGLLLAGGGAMVHPILSLIVLGGFSLAAWNMLSSSYLARKSLKNMSFYLVESGCREKESKCQGEDGMAYILTFENGHCHTIDHGDISLLAGGGNDWEDEKLYDNTELGDRFFLV